MNTHRHYSDDYGQKTDSRKTYQEYRASIHHGGKTTMSDAQRKKARAKRKRKSC